MDLLSTVELRLDNMAELVENWKDSPVTITTSWHEQLELDISIHQLN
jgi:hypothetical protein